MLPKFHKMWEIVESQEFSDQLATIEPDAPRADEFVEGAVMTLSRRPTAGKQLTEHIWFLPMFKKNVAIYYTFDDSKVYLMAIHAVEG